MEILYPMIIISLLLSFGFLWSFFWVVDNDQLSSIDEIGYSILDEDNSEELKNEK